MYMQKPVQKPWTDFLEGRMQHLPNILHLPPPSQKFKCSFWITVNKNKNKDFEQNKTKNPNIFHFLEAVCVQIPVQVN